MESAGRIPRDFSREGGGLLEGSPGTAASYATRGRQSAPRIGRRGSRGWYFSHSLSFFFSSYMPSCHQYTYSKINSIKG